MGPEPELEKPLALLPDAVLLQQLYASPDNLALETLLERYRDKLLFTIRHVKARYGVARETDDQEVLNELTVKILEAKAKRQQQPGAEARACCWIYDPSKGAVEKWLLTRTHYLTLGWCRDRLRARKRAAQLQETRVGPRPASRFGWENDLLDLVDRLPRLERRALRLYFLRGLTDVEVGRRLFPNCEASPLALGLRAHRLRLTAQKKLRELVEKEDLALEGQGR